MKVLTTVALALSLAVGLTACQSSDQKVDGKASADGKAAGDSKAAAKGEMAKLPKLGLQVELPTGSMVEDAIGGGQGHMIMSVTGPFNVSLAGDDKPKTVDAAKKDAEMFNPTNFKSETLPDGWVVTWENTGSAGTNYWLTVRREIGGKAYICDTSVAKESQRSAALAACKSLKQ
jgi:hypothetical protein